MTLAPEQLRGLDWTQLWQVTRRCGLVAGMLFLLAAPGAELRLAAPTALGDENQEAKAGQTGPQKAPEKPAPAASTSDNNQKPEGHGIRRGANEVGWRAGVAAATDAVLSRLCVTNTAIHTARRPPRRNPSGSNSTLFAPRRMPWHPC